jgi:hypothetical protein
MWVLASALVELTKDSVQECTVHLIFRIPGGGGFMAKTPDGETHAISLCGTVKELKWTMSEKLGVPVSRLVLLAKGRVVSDGK